MKQGTSLRDAINGAVDLVFTLVQYYSIFVRCESTILKIAEGQFLIRNEFLSADPAMRGWIADKRF